MEIERVLGRVEKKAEKLSSDSRKKLCEKILECTKSFFQPQSVMEVKDSGGFKEEVEMKDDSCMMETTPEKFPRRRVDAKTSQPAKSATKRRTTSLACTSEPIPAFHLQAEQLLCIFRFLSHQDLRKSLLVCKLWNTAACDDRLWSWMYSKADFKMPEVMPTSWRKEFLRVEQRHQRWASGTCRKKRLAGHRAAVNCMSVEGNLLVTGSDDHDLRVWNLLEKDATSVRLHGHKGKVVCCCIVDKLVASGSEDCLVILWNISNGKAKMRFRQHLQPVTCLATDKKRLVFSGSVDMQVCIWCTSSLSNIAVLRDHRLAVFCLSFISPLQLLVSGGKESEVRVWRLRDKNKPAIILRGHSASVTSLDTTDSLIASGSDDRSVRLWDAFTGSCLRSFLGHGGPVSALKLTGSRLFTGSFDGKVRMFDLLSGRCNKIMNGHKNSILSLSASEAFCISGANDHDVRVWDCRGETWRLPAADVRAVEGSYPGSVHDSMEAEESTDDESPDEFYEMYDRSEAPPKKILSPAISCNSGYSLRGHFSGVQKVAMVGERFVVSASDDYHVCVWDFDG